MPTVSKVALLSFTAFAAVNASGYVEFCESNYSDCGIAVATSNDGCVQESGRTSLHFTEGDGGLYFPIMIAYSDSNCQTEQGCNSIGQDGTEQDIDFTLNQAFKYALNAQSFKFVTGSPPQCPNGCTGLCASSKRSRIEGRLPEPVVNNNAKAEDISKRQDGANFWFCDDSACSVNCGNKIEINAAGCANGESGRQSVYFTGAGSTQTQLGAFDNSDCSGGQVATFSAVNGCNVLPSQHEAWQVLGIQG